MTNTDIQFYLKELRSEECFCGKAKKPGRSFCYPCFNSLPRDMQRDLYHLPAADYAEAYDKAVEWLEG